MIDFLPAVLVLVFVGVYLIGALWVQRRFVPPHRTIIVHYLENAATELQRIIDSIDRFGNATIMLTARIYELEHTLRLRSGIAIQGLGTDRTRLTVRKK